jgi:hypothetical protein
MSFDSRIIGMNLVANAGPILSLQSKRHRKRVVTAACKKNGLSLTKLRRREPSRSAAVGHTADRRTLGSKITECQSQGSPAKWHRRYARLGTSWGGCQSTLNVKGKMRPHSAGFFNSAPRRSNSRPSECRWGKLEEHTMVQPPAGRLWHPR